jgi:heat shock protein HslJ
MEFLMHDVLARIAALLLATALAGCANAPAAPTPVPDPLAGSTWILAALPGRSLVAGPAVTLRFAEGSAQGSDGCNRYFTPYSAGAGRIEVSPRGAATLMACPPELMQQATEYGAALANARAYRLEGRQLQLLAGDGQALAVFSAQDTALAGTSWRVTAINNGRQAVVSVAAGSALSMAFTSEGRLSGSAGCNNYTAAFSDDSGRVSIQPPAATRRMCAGKGVMEQEQWLLAALATVATARIEGNRLELRSAGGALAVAAVRE